jgi:hypothetical protein
MKTDKKNLIIGSTLMIVVVAIGMYLFFGVNEIVTKILTAALFGAGLIPGISSIKKEAQKGNLGGLTFTLFHITAYICLIYFLFIE